MGVALLLLLAGQASGPVSPPTAAPLASYHRLTRAEVPCDNGGGTEIVVCAAREADRYRVPLVASADIDRDMVPAHTARMLDPATFSCGITGPFLTQCAGMVGAHTQIGFDGKVSVSERPLAP